MKETQQSRCFLDFKSGYPVASAALMGLSFFLRMAYYFGLKNFTQLNILEVLFGAILPVLVCGGYIYLLAIRKLNSSNIYGLMGGALCLLFMLNGFFVDGIISILLSIVFYLAAGVAYLATMSGTLRDKTLAPVLLIVLALGRLVNLLFFTSGISAWILGLSVILALSSMFALILCLKDLKRKPQRNENKNRPA